jgi:hypothetical protein
VDLDLVHRGHHGRGPQELVEVLRHEVADADRAYPAVGEQRFQRPVRLDREVEAGRHGLVQQEQVDPLDAELAGTLVEGVQGRVVTVVRDPDLRLHEHLGPVDLCHAGTADGVADAALVEVGGRRVDEPIPVGQGQLDGIGGLVGWGLEHTEPQRRHLDAVVESERVAVVRQGFSSR